MKVLFVCNQNKNRSKTAQGVFKKKFLTKSAGLYNERPIKESQLRWADLVVVMEDEQRTELGRRFPKIYLQKRIVSLGIPDTFLQGDEKLKELLAEKLESIL